MNLTDFLPKWMIFFHLSDFVVKILYKFSSWTVESCKNLHNASQLFHHYDQSLAVSKAASTLMKQTSPSVSSPRSLDHAIFRQQRQQLTLEMASSACHDSLISACVGLPSYQESFAVDPNEILSKDRATRVSKNHYYFWFDCFLLIEHRCSLLSVVTLLLEVY